MEETTPSCGLFHPRFPGRKPGVSARLTMQAALQEAGTKPTSFALTWAPTSTEAHVREVPGRRSTSPARSYFARRRLAPGSTASAWQGSPGGCTAPRRVLRSGRSGDDQAGRLYQRQAVCPGPNCRPRARPAAACPAGRQARARCHALRRAVAATRTLAYS
jgi:hypothetical protein